MHAKLFFIYLLPILLCGHSCGPFGDYELIINFQNNSDYTILSAEEYDYPDTTLREKLYFETTLPKSYGRAASSTRRWHRVIVNGKMCLFLLDKDVVDNVPWETVREDYMILQRYDLSIADLEKLNWTIYYPPTEAMKDIYMYPPYEEAVKMRQ